HAVESYVCTKANPVSSLFAAEAWRLLSAHFERVLTDPTNLPARAAMQLGAHLAGSAIEASMLGCAHACANPLTTRYGTTHGMAVGVLLPHVVRFNESVCHDTYAQLDPHLPERLSGYLRAARLPATLRDLGV